MNLPTEFQFTDVCILPIMLNLYHILGITTLWANSADVKDNFFLIFLQKVDFDISCKLSPNLHEMSKPIFLEKYLAAI